MCFQKNIFAEEVPPYRTKNVEREKLFNRINKLESLDTYKNLSQTHSGVTWPL